MSELDPTSYEFERKLLDSIKKREGNVTVGDVASDTGLPYDGTEIALRRMLSVYESHLDVDDDGNLRYRFLQPMVRRGESMTPFLYKVKDGIWRVGRWVFKVWTMVMLVGYTAAFIILLIVISMASRSSDNNNRRGGDLGGGAFYLAARIIDYIFWIRLFSEPNVGYSSNQLYGGGRAEERHDTDVPFYEKVNRFVFGPFPEKESREEQQQRLAQFIRHRKGIVSAADWSEQTGLSLEEADSALTDALNRFSGDINVTPDGTLLYQFDQMKVTATEGSLSKKVRNFQPIWKKSQKTLPFTGNGIGANLGIGVMGVFIFIMSLVCLFLNANSLVLFQGSQLQPYIASMGFQIGFGWVPLLYAICFFLVPILRIIPHFIRKGKAAAEERRLKGIERIWASTQDGKADFVDLKPYPEKTLVMQFEGDVDIEAGRPDEYRFQVVANQRYAASAARAAADREIVFGKTIYSSDPDKYDERQGELDDFDAMVREELGENACYETEFTTNSPESQYEEEEMSVYEKARRS